MNKFITLTRQKVFVDANVILYHLTGLVKDFSELCQMVRQKRGYLFTSLRVVDEVLFKTNILKAREIYKYSRNILQKLKKDKEKIKKLANEIAFLEGFFSDFYIAVPTEKDLWHSLEVQKEYGLIGNDALILVLMRRLKIKNLISSDTDFKNIPGINLVKGDWLAVSSQ